MEGADAKICEIRKFGADANEGYRFFLEMPHNDKMGDDVWWFEAMDDADADDWMRSEQQESSDPEAFMGGRFELHGFKLFVNFKKEPAP